MIDKYPLPLSAKHNLPTAIQDILVKKTKPRRQGPFTEVEQF